jgi:hypothetical protein
MIRSSRHDIADIRQRGGSRGGHANVVNDSTKGPVIMGLKNLDVSPYCMKDSMLYLARSFESA